MKIESAPPLHEFLEAQCPTCQEAQAATPHILRAEQTIANMLETMSGSHRQKM